MKKIFVFIFFLLPVFVHAFTGEVVIDGINYFIVTKGKTAEVRAGNYSGDIVIPATVEYDNVPCNVTAIGDWAFNGCKDLESISIGENVTTIGSYSFNGCSKLTSINWPSNLTEIGFCAFTYCTTLPSITVPNSVVSIKDHAFAGCSSLATVEMGDNVNYIGDFAFQDCISLKTISLSQSLSSISRDVFNGCISLESIAIPDNVTSIGYRSFFNCKNIQNVILGNSVTQINESAFNGCASLSAITIPKNVISIGISAFEGCEKLSYVAVPDGVTSIERNAFYGCSSLKQVVIGSGISFISDKAFAQCSDISDVYCYSESVPNTNWDVFQDSYIEYATLHVPESSIEAYSIVQPWKNFKKIVKAMPLHTLTFMVDGEVYKSYQVEEDAAIPIETEPTKEGYTFSGWSEIPSTMPAKDITISGTFIINSYKLTYVVDGVEYKTFEVEYDSAITPEEEPTKEGHTFSGWSEIPETMPANDVTVTGSFIVNKYQVTYIIDGEVFATDYVEYGATIVPPTVEDKEGYTFDGWADVPETMPAYDLTIYGSFTSGIAEIVMETKSNVRIYSPNGKKIDKLQKGLNVVVLEDGNVKKIIVR